MRKTKAKILLICALGLSLLLTACGAEPKTITEEGMTITLTEDFSAATMDNATWYYESTDALVMGIRETKDELEQTGLEVNTLRDYAKAVIEANSLTGTTIQERNDYLYIEYEKTVDGTNYSYMTCLYDHGEEYWLVNFTCYQQRYKKLKSNFLDWADSVSFN